MRKVFTIIGLVCLVGGAIFAGFTGLDVALYVELAGAAATLASCVVALIKKAPRKDWKLYTAIIGIIVGVILLVWAGIAESLITTIITAVIGLVVLLLSIIVPLFSYKKETEKK